MSNGKSSMDIFDECKKALLNKDVDAFLEAMATDSFILHQDEYNHLSLMAAFLSVKKFI